MRYEITRPDLERLLRTGSIRLSDNGDELRYLATIKEVPIDCNGDVLHIKLPDTGPMRIVLRMVANFLSWRCPQNASAIQLVDTIDKLAGI